MGFTVILKFSSIPIQLGPWLGMEIRWNIYKNGRENASFRSLQQPQCFSNPACITAVFLHFEIRFLNSILSRLLSCKNLKKYFVRNKSHKCVPQDIYFSQYHLEAAMIMKLIRMRYNFEYESETASI